jgi:hypothetical protein
MFAEDLSAFFDTANGFAQNATLLGGAVMPVIFDNAYQGSMGGFVESTGPQCVAKTADVAALVQGSTITVNAIAYKVAIVQPDGTGLTTLQLELA